MSRFNHAALISAAYASRDALPHPHARLASGWWLTFTGRESNPLDSNEKFLSVTSNFLLSQVYPGATVNTPHYWSPRRKSWFDQGGNLVEQKIPKILGAFFEHAQEIKAKRAEDERRHRERAEQERLRKEREDRRDAHDKLRDELDRQAGAWHRARFLRRYIQAARRATSSRPVRLPFVDSTVDFLEWATNYVDQLEPLSNVRKNPDQWPEPRSYVYAAWACIDC